MESHFGARDEEPEPVTEPEPEGEVRILRAVPDDGPVAALIADSDNHRKEVASRVSFLFPRPETTEWSTPTSAMTASAELRSTRTKTPASSGS